MPVPEQLLQQQMAPKPPGGMPGMPQPGGPQGASPMPAAAPMPQPQEKGGKKAAAMVNVHIAANMLEQALIGVGSESEEGGHILKALNMLTKLIGQKGNDSGDLVPAEVMQMVRQMPQQGGGTDMQRMLLKQMQNPAQNAPQQPPGA